MRNLGIFNICVTLIFLSIVVSFTVFKIDENALKSRNMDTAIEKGIDPLAVRCSYANSDDNICVAYAASAQSHNTTTISNSVSKK